MLAPITQDRLVKFVNTAIGDLGLDVAATLAAWDRVAASPDLRLAGDPVELRAEVEALAWDAAAKGCPELAIDD